MLLLFGCNGGVEEPSRSPGRHCECQREHRGPSAGKISGKSRRGKQLLTLARGRNIQHTDRPDPNILAQTRTLFVWKVLNRGCVFFFVPGSRRFF